MSRYALSLAACLFLGACASPRGGELNRDDPNGLRGANVALPVALALTGLGSNPHGPLEIDRLEPVLDAQFDRFDTDGSEALSAIEHAQWALAILGDAYGRPTLRMMDRDGDRMISQGEFVAAMRAAAKRLDADKDGFVSRAEMLMEVPESRRGSRQSLSGERPGGQGDRPQR